VESSDILRRFVGHRRVLHMAFRIRFVTDVVEVAVFKQAGRKLEM
jgi:hypothetical protein